MQAAKGGTHEATRSEGGLMKVYILMVQDKTDGKNSVRGVFAQRSAAETQKSRLYADPDRGRP
jgi:hypothetical protein